MCKYLLEYLFSILWGINLGVELLGHVLILCLPFSKTARVFPTVAVPFCTSTSNVCGFQFLHILANNVTAPNFDYRHPKGYEVVSHSFFWFAFLGWLMMCRIVSFVYWPFIQLLWRTMYSFPLSMLKLGYLSFHCGVVKVLYIFWLIDHY